MSAANRNKRQQDDDDDGFDIETFLRTQVTSFNQDAEVNRILGLKKTSSNPLEVLDISDPKLWLTPTAIPAASSATAPATASGSSSAKDTQPLIDPKLIKVTYRKKSLLVHPDKCKHPQASEAFEMLKKAETELSDEGKVKWLLAVIAEARMSVYRRRKIVRVPTGDGDDVKELVIAVKLETRRMLVEQSQRDGLRLKNEVERKEKEQVELAEEKKRKAEHDKQWEDTRDTRVDSWRTFLKKGEKVKKRKKEAESNPNVLG